MNMKKSMENHLCSSNNSVFDNAQPKRKHF